MDTNDELIDISSDDEAILAMEARKRAATRRRIREAAARRRVREAAAKQAAANRVVAIRGPNKPGSCSYDKFFVYGNHVALNSAEVSYLKEVARKRPTIPVYVCTIKEAHTDDTKGKMYFSRKYTLANIMKHLKLPTKVKVFMKNYSMEARVRVIMSKTKGKGAQMTTCWKEVVVAANMQVGNIFMFRSATTL